MNAPLQTDDFYKYKGMKKLCRCLSVTKRGNDVYAKIKLNRTTLEVNAEELLPMFRICLN